MTDSSPYLTLAETADLVRVSVKRLRNLMAAGIFLEGVHYSRPAHLGPRFKRAAILAWLEGRDPGTVAASSRLRRRRPRCKLDKSLL